MAARLVNLADVAEVFHRAGGGEAAVTLARERTGTQFDPALVQLFATEAAPQDRWAELLGEVEAWFARNSETDAGGVALPMEYLVVLGQKGS